MLDHLGDHDERLKDPQSRESDQLPYARNPLRARRAQTFVAVGICTHLGCLPKSRFDVDAAGMGAFATERELVVGMDQVTT